MPNQCYGRLVVYTDDDNLMKKIQETLHGTEDDNPFDFNKVIPMPENIYRGSIGRKEEELYGKNNWYDWSWVNWGTKWNSCETALFGGYDDEDTEPAEYIFWTAWGPCSPVIKQLSKMFPDAGFEYWWDNVQECGQELYENGKPVFIMQGENNTYQKKYDDIPEQYRDYCEGREDEEKEIIQSEGEYYKGKYHLREDFNGQIRIVNGEFLEIQVPYYNTHFDLFPFIEQERFSKNI